jgi:transcriptional regulator with XRE-family HTH domain
MDFSGALAKAIKRRRKEIGLSQEALAFKVGSNQRYISEIELGVKNPTVKFAHELSVALETRFSDLASQAEQEMASGS